MSLLLTALSTAGVLEAIALGIGAISGSEATGTILSKLIKDVKREQWLNKEGSSAPINLNDNLKYLQNKLDSSGQLLNEKHGESDKAAIDKLTATEDMFNFKEEAAMDNLTATEKVARLDSSGNILNAKHGESDKAAMDKLLATEGLFNFDQTTTGGNNETPQEGKDKNTPIPPGITNSIGGNEESSNNENGAIQDGTDLNTGTTTVTPMDWLAKIEEWRDNDRAREDQIRAETQAREDTAWQRGIEDLRKSGANINLVAAQPAQSGGGITSATGVNTSVLTNSMNNEIKEMLQNLEQNFKGDENDKDRFMNSFFNLMSTIGMIMAIAGKG